MFVARTFRGTIGQSLATRGTEGEIGTTHLCGICNGTGSVEGKSTEQIVQADSMILFIPAMQNNSVDHGRQRRQSKAAEE